MKRVPKVVVDSAHKWTTPLTMFESLAWMIWSCGVQLCSSSEHETLAFAQGRNRSPEEVIPETCDRPNEPEGVKDSVCVFRKPG